MTSVYGNPSAIPVWGECQEGDGSAIGAATPSTAEIVFTGIPSSGTIFVMGVAVTATWATNADTCANNLATAINALATVSVGPASFTVKSQVRNHLYARGPTLGAPAGTCQVMTRQGSAAHTGLVCFTHTLNNVSSAGTVNFSGGTGGAWGYLLAAYTLWPSGIATTAWGLFQALPWTGSLNAGDVVIIRSNKRLFLAQGSSYYMHAAAMGSADNYVTYAIDDSTVWSDGVDPYIEVSLTSGGGLPVFEIGGQIGTYLHIQGRRYGGGQHALVFLANGAIAVANNIPVIREGVEFKTTNVTGTVKLGTYGAGGNFSQRLSCVLKQSRLTWANQVVSASFFNAPSTISRNQLIDVIFDCGAATAAQPKVFEGVLASGSNNCLVELTGCKFINFLSGSTLVSAVTASDTQSSRSLVFRNCDFGGITILGPNLLTLASSWITSRTGVPTGMIATSEQGAQDWFIDGNTGWAAWVSTRSFPTLNARLKDGTSPWSVQAITTSVANNIGIAAPLELPRFVKINSLPTAERTFTLSFGVEETLALNKMHLSMLVEYVDADGNMQYVDSYDPAGGAFDSGGGDAWTNNVSSTQFSYANAGTLYFNKYRLSVTTPTAIATDTEIGFFVRLHKATANGNQMVFVDPEVVMV